MTNLDKLKELFPNDWDLFFVPKGWSEKEYNPNRHDITNQEAFKIAFGEDGKDVGAPAWFWDSIYQNEIIID